MTAGKATGENAGKLQANAEEQATTLVRNAAALNADGVLKRSREAQTALGLLEQDQVRG